MAESRTKKLGTKVVGWVIVLAVLAAPVVYYFRREPVVQVTAAPLKKGHVEQTITAMASGTVKPKIDAMVAASTIGKVIAKRVQEGDRVKEGDVMIELDHAELDAQVALAEANLRVGQSRLEQVKIAAAIYEEIAETRVSQAEAQLEVAKADYERVKALSNRQAVSQSDFDKVGLMYRVAKETDVAAKAAAKENLVRREEVKSAESLIEQLQAALKLATEMRDKAYVRAPFPGVVAKVFVELGEVVGSGLGAGLGGAMGGMAGGGVGGTGAGGGATTSGAASGLSMGSATALVQLVDDSEYYVKSPFDEANAMEIKAGQKARVGFDAYRGEDFAGTVNFISPTITRNIDLSRTLDIDVHLEGGQGKLLAGMSADVIIIAQEKDDVLFVPAEALIREEESYVIEDGRAVRRKVSVGLGNWQAREVLDGLKEGETVITSVGLKELKNGVKVQVVDSLD